MRRLWRWFLEKKQERLIIKWLYYKGTKKERIYFYKIKAISEKLGVVENDNSDYETSDI